MRTFTLQWPTAAVPAWAERVPRWQQMDPVARAVTEAWYEWFGMNSEEAPAMLLVASPKASHLADLEFARSGAFSPQRFVATLPSVALAPVLQMTGLVLPVLCIQDGAHTLATALAEADVLSRSGVASVGVLTYDPGALDVPADAPRTVTVSYYEC